VLFGDPIPGQHHTKIYYQKILSKGHLLMIFFSLNSGFYRKNKLKISPLNIVDRRYLEEKFNWIPTSFPTLGLYAMIAS